MGDGREGGNVSIRELQKLIRDLGSLEVEKISEFNTIWKATDAVEELIALKKKPVDAIADAAAINTDRRGL